jgi:hypothetical protein
MRMPSTDACVLPGGVRDIIPVPAWPGEEPGTAREVPGELDCSRGSSPAIFLGSENVTRRLSPSPDLERSGCTGLKGLAEGYLVRPLACSSSASARIVFISTLQRPCVLVRIIVSQKTP